MREYTRTGHGSYPRLLLALLLSVSALSAPAFAAAAITDITQLSLEQLLDVSIIGASKYEQKQDEVAAAVSVITRFEVNLPAIRRVELNLSSKLLRLASEVRQ